MTRFVSRIPIEKGWSGDKKYRAVTEDGTTVLLRVSVPERLPYREACYRYMQGAAGTGIPMCRPLDFFLSEEGVCTVMEWVDGDDLEEILPSLSGTEQYRLGVRAGEMLRSLHTLAAPADAEDWGVRFGRKIDRKMEMYRACPLRYPVDQPLFDCIEHYRHLLAGRPQVMQHGDYHVGNMMLRDGQIVIIDFDRSDHGDPWEEFNRIVWCAQTSPSFAAGQVDGYFSARVPQAFWQMLALYIATNTLSSLPWAIPFGQGEIDTMTAQAAQVIAWYDGMRRTVPTWYEAGRTVRGR